MADELQEFEVCFPESVITGSTQPEDSDSRELQGKNKKLKRKSKASSRNSAPVDINPAGISWVQYVEPDFFDDYDDGEMVPPHVIVRRRVAGKMAFSVCTGNGRTLKGRDLSEVRNSILRRTGFLET